MPNEFYQCHDATVKSKIMHFVQSGEKMNAPWEIRLWFPLTMLTSTFGSYIRPMLELHGFNPEAYIPFPFGSGIAFSSSTITFQPIPNNHDPFCPCFKAGRQPHTHIRILLAGEILSLFSAYLHPCPLDSCSYAEKPAKIQNFNKCKDSVITHGALNVNIIGNCC